MLSIELSRVTGPTTRGVSGDSSEGFRYEYSMTLEVKASEEGVNQGLFDSQTLEIARGLGCQNVGIPVGEYIVSTN